MSGRALLFLVLLVAGLGAFIWFYEKDLPSSEEREELARRVLRFEREQVARVTLETSERRVVLERLPGAMQEAEVSEEAAETPDDTDDRSRWRLVHPLEYAADYWAVDALVRSLAELEKSRTLEEWEATEVGLAAPRGEITVELEDGDSRVLLIGAAVPASDNMIVAVQGRPQAFVVPASLWESVEKEAGEWRDKQVFTAQREDILDIRLSSGERTVLLERRDGDFWLVEPREDRAEPDSVSSLLREMTGLRVDRFLDDPPPLDELGLEPPRGRIEATLRTGNPLTLLWGAETTDEEANYARAGELVFTTTADLGTALDRSPAEWQARSWSSLPVYEIDVVEVEATAGDLELRREEGSWQRGEERIEQGVVSDLLYAVDDARAERLASPDELQVGSPILKLRLVSDDGEEERLELYPPGDGDLAPARTAGRDTLLLLSRGTSDEIQARLEEVREAEPLTPETEEEPDAG